MHIFTKRFLSLSTKLFAAAVIAVGALLAACEEPPTAEPAKQSTVSPYIALSGAPIDKLNSVFTRVEDPTTLPNFAPQYSIGGSVDISKPAYHALIGAENWYVWSSSDGYRITQAGKANDWLLEYPNIDSKAPDSTQVQRWIVPKAGKTAADIAAEVASNPYNTSPRTYGDAPSINVFTPQKPPATSVAVTPRTATIPANGSVQLSAAVIPAEANQTVIWASNNNDIALVDQKGRVMGVAPGTVTIHARSGNWFSDFATITVTQPTNGSAGQTPLPTIVTVSPKNPSIVIGGSVQLSARVNPIGSDQTVTWTSSNAGVATVSANGIVTGASTGTATITARSSDGVTNSTSVTVNKPAATGVWISAQNVSVTIGGTTQLYASVLPSTADQTVTWSSSNTGVATVSGSGVVQGVSAGSVTITAQSLNGVTDSTSVTVNQLAPVATRVTVAPKSVALLVGKTAQLSAIVAPAGTNQTVTWSSSDNRVASMFSDGTVTGAGPGTATITATTANGLTDTTTVTVTQPLPVVVITPTDAILEIGLTLQLTANQPIVQWSMSPQNTYYATVDQNGLVKALRIAPNGNTYTISATAASGQFATTTVTVVPSSITGVTVAPKWTSMAVGETVQLSARVTPSTSYQTVTWSSDNTSVATITANGLVQGVGAGWTTLTATTANGLTDRAVVVINTAVPRSVAISSKNPTVTIGGTTQLSASVTPFSADQTIRWTSSNESIATIDANGLVRGIAPGNVLISAISSNGVSDGEVLTVNGYPATSVTVTPKSVTLSVGGSAKLSASVTPFNASKVTWTSSNRNVASMFSDGTVVGVSAGTAIITATTTNGLTDTTVITVQ